MTHKTILNVSCLALAIAIAASHAHARFESVHLWNAEYAGVGGAAVSSVDDSSALYFNPAGLGFIERDDIRLDFSPMLGQTNGPAGANGKYTKGEKNLIPAGGNTGSRIINDRMTLGFGIYAVGGLSSLYEDITAGSGATAITGDYKSDMKILEGSVGLGYRLNDNWSLGASYRITYTHASLSMLSAMGPVGAEIEYKDMTGFNTFGYRLGAMYRADNDRWGWGIHYRSSVKMEADGKTSYRNGVGVGEYSKQKVTVKTELPMQLSTGAHYRLTNVVSLYGEIQYSNYKAIDSIDFSSKDTDLVVSSLNTNWQDQYSFRIGADYTGIDNWTLRTGYIYTTNTVKEEYAAPTFSTPDILHSLSLGAGTTFMDGKLKFDTALQYSFAENKNAKGGGNLSAAATSPGGKYDSNSIALHTSLIYFF